MSEMNLDGITDEMTEDELLAALGLSGGGGWTDFDAKITEARWCEAQRGDGSPITDDDGNPLTNLELTLAPVDDEPNNGDPFTRGYMPQRTWTHTDDGSFVHPEDDENDVKSQINNGTRAGRLMVAAVKCEGFADIARAKLKSGLTPRHADFLVGTTFHWETVEYDSMNPATKEKIKSNVLLPVAFVSYDGPSGAKKSTAKKSAAKKAAAKAKPAKAEVDTDAPPAERLTAAQTKGIKAAFDEAPDDESGFDVFLAAALEVDGITDDEALYAWVRDGDGDDGAWAMLIEGKV